MKKLPLLLLSALTLAAASAGASRPAPVSPLATRPADRQTRQVAPFTAVDAAGAMNVVVRQGSPQQVEVDASAADQGKIETEVEGGRLRVGRRREGRDILRTERFEGPVTVYVTAPSLTALSVSGSGDLRVAGPVQASSFQVRVAGSGNLSLPQLTAQALKTSLAGSGNITLGGSCPQHEVSISGSGNVRADELRTDDTSVRISGSGNVRANATKTLNSRISGSGDVLVRGNPQISSSKSGSGSVKRM
jgi:hypothetical protein